MKKLISLLLALMLVMSIIPAVSAVSLFDFQKIEVTTDSSNKTTYTGYKFDNTTVNLSEAEYNSIVEQYKAYVESLEKQAQAAAHDPGKHEFNGYGSNTKYHWLQCACGCKISMERHVDPKDAANDYCICGYHFSDNADLVTLWVDGCPPIKGFSKDTTEYKLNAYTYKDVKEIKISTRTFDSEATVELPKDLTLKNGENKIEVKVTSENQKVTKIYTLIITK